MKSLKFLLPITCSLILAACSTAEDHISGTYILNFKNEYTTTNDTLIIEDYNRPAGVYKLQRRAGYKLIRDGKELPKQFKQESWMATFNKEKQVLQETELGRQVYIGADGQSLSFQGTYHKIR